MSNRAALEATEFKNIHDGHISYGYRLYDDYGSCYNNFHEENIGKLSDGDLFKLAVSEKNEDDASAHILEYAIEEGGGLEINGTFYSDEELQEMVK